MSALASSFCRWSSAIRAPFSFLYLSASSLLFLSSVSSHSLLRRASSSCCWRESSRYLALLSWPLDACSACWRVVISRESSTLRWCCFVSSSEMVWSRLLLASMMLRFVRFEDWRVSILSFRALISSLWPVPLVLRV